MRIKTETRFLVSMLLTFCLLLLPVTAFAKKGEKNFKAGLRYEANQQWEKAAQEFTLAIAADPSSPDYQLHFRRATFNASQAYMQQGRSLAEQNDFVGAYNAFRLAYGYDAVNELAVSEMERMLRLQGVKEGNSSGGTNGTKSETQDAGTPASASNQEAAVPSSGPQQMRIIAYTGDLKDFIRRFANELNLNVIFDRQSFVTPKNIDINLKDVTTSQALDYVFLQEGLFFQKLSRRTIVVADQARRPQYQQLVLRTFYLANSDPDKVKQLVSQAIPPSVGRPQTIVVSDKDTNSLTVRDTAENVRLIGELITSIDKDRAEVVMDVNIYEVSKSDLMQLGNQMGGDGGTLTLGGSPGLSVITSNGTLDRLRTGVNLASIVGGAPTAAAAALLIPPSVLTAFQSKNNTKLIASTQVHAFNNEESTARIGQRVPVQTAQAFPFGVTQTGTQQPSTQNPFGGGGFPVINYEPTGLTLRFTPQVFPNHDVQVKMSIESKDVLGAGTLTPTFTERTITGTARVQNNRTMMLASVSQDVQTNGRRGLPILGGLPVVGRLFSSPTRDNRQIDIVIAVTPRVIRAPAVTPRDLEMRPSGTLQSPTTGSLEAMLREADQEDRFAAAQLEKANATAKANEPKPAANVPASATNNQTPPAATVPNTVATNNASANPAPAPSTVVAASGSNAATTSDPGIFKSSAAPPQQTPPASSRGEDELAAFVPAPKSLVTNQSATEVAAINANLTTGANAVLTSLPKPIETSVNAVSAPIRTSQVSLLTGDETLKVGEKRWLTLKLNSDTPLALGTVALRFDPKTVKINAVSAGTLLAKVKEGAEPGASVMQSINPGICLVSISNLNGVASIKGDGVLLYVEVEALAPGDAGLVFEKGAMHFVGMDARDVVVEVSPIRAIVKQ